MYKGFNYEKYCKGMMLIIDFVKMEKLPNEIRLNYADTDLITKIDSISVVSTTPFDCKRLPYIYISDLFFIPKKRRQGMGLKKFLEIKQKCIENGINEIQIEPILETEEFWVKLGFVEIPNPYDIQVKRMSLKF